MQSSAHNSPTFRFSHYYYLFPEMGTYPVFWLSLGVTNVLALLPVFVMKWWLTQCVPCAFAKLYVPISLMCNMIFQAQSRAL
jgi:hypothetical protein